MIEICPADCYSQFLRIASDLASSHGVDPIGVRDGYGKAKHTQNLIRDLLIVRRYKSTENSLIRN